MSGKFFDTPYCLSFGACGEALGGGGIDDYLPMMPGPVSAKPSGERASRTDAAASRVGDEGETLTLYCLRMPNGGGFEPIAADETSWVERGGAIAGTARNMLAVLARRGGVPAERVPVVEEYSAVGPGRFLASFAAPDGDGYAVRAEPFGGGTRTRVCAIRGRVVTTSLADATLYDGDLLCVRIRGGGNDYALALAPRRDDARSPATAEAARMGRARFALEAGAFTARAGVDRTRFALVDVPPTGCP